MSSPFQSIRNSFISTNPNENSMMQMSMVSARLAYKKYSIIYSKIFKQSIKIIYRSIQSSPEDQQFVLKLI
jgi:hypothetical protein